MLAKLKSIITAPFRWGFEAVDTRPSGSAYRKVTRQLSAVATTTKGEIALVVGEGLTEKLPVVDVLKAETPEAAVNAALKYVNGMRRSKARAIQKLHKTIARDARVAQRAEQKAAEGNSPRVSNGRKTRLTPSSEGSGLDNGEGVAAGSILAPA